MNRRSMNRRPPYGVGEPRFEFSSQRQMAGYSSISKLSSRLPLGIINKPAFIANSGFPSAQMEAYYNRLIIKMYEFLSEFAIYSLTKEINNINFQVNTSESFNENPMTMIDNNSGELTLDQQGILEQPKSFDNKTNPLFP